MSYIEYLRRNKGVQKQTTLWKKDLMNDYVYDQDLKNSYQEIENRLEAFSKKMIVETSTIKKGKTRIPLRMLKVPKDFSFGGYWEKLTSTFFTSLALILPLKDLFALLACSKQLSKTKITDELWRLILNRDFPKYGIKEDAINYISVKQYYIFLNSSKKPGIAHHTGFMIREGTLKTFGLTTTLIDFASSKHLKRIFKMKVECEIPGDMKLSWLKEENKLMVWVEVGNDWCQVIHTYELPERERIQRAFFLDEKYLVVETSQEEWEQTIRIYDLRKDMMDLITRNGELRPLAVTFNRETIASALADRSEEEIDSNKIVVEVEAVQGESAGKLALGVKMLTEDLVILYKKNSIHPLLVVGEMSSGKRIWQETLKMNSDDGILCDILVPKKPNRKQFYLVDFKLNVYAKSYITEEDDFQVSSESELILQTDYAETSRLIDDNLNLYHHGVLNDVEYLVTLDQTHRFTFVNLENLNIHHQFQAIVLKGHTISNWSINEDNLMWLNRSLVHSAKFSWENEKFSIKKLGQASTEENSNIAREWIFINPCYTLYITTPTFKSRQPQRMYISVSSTQKLLLAATYTVFGTLADFFDENVMNGTFIDLVFNQSYDIDNFLSESIRDRSKEGKGQQGEFLFKFEGEKLLIKTSEKSFFFDFERYWRQSHVINNKWRDGILKLDVLTLFNSRMIRKSQQMGMAEGNKNIILKNKDPKLVTVTYKENKNGLKAKPKTRNWKKSRVPETIKEHIKTLNFIRHGGYKFYKIVRRGQRNEKYDEGLDLESFEGLEGEYNDGDENDNDDGYLLSTSEEDYF